MVTTNHHSFQRWAKSTSSTTCKMMKQNAPVIPIPKAAINDYHYMTSPFYDISPLLNAKSSFTGMKKNPIIIPNSSSHLKNQNLQGNIWYISKCTTYSYTHSECMILGLGCSSHTTWWWWRGNRNKQPQTSHDTLPNIQPLGYIFLPVHHTENSGVYNNINNILHDYQLIYVVKFISNSWRTKYCWEYHTK